MSYEILDIKVKYGSAETCWIDCHQDGKLLASGGYDNAIKIFDRREGKIAKELNSYSGWIYSVRWHSDGIHLASAAQGTTAKLIDIRAEKAVCNMQDVWTAPCDKSIYSVCFL